MAAKLRDRLGCVAEELDAKIAEVMFDGKGRLDLVAVPTKYEYCSGDGKIQFSSK